MSSGRGPYGWRRRPSSAISGSKILWAMTPESLLRVSPPKLRVMVPVGGGASQVKPAGGRRRGVSKTAEAHPCSSPCCPCCGASGGCWMAPHGMTSPAPTPAAAAGEEEEDNQAAWVSLRRQQQQPLQPSPSTRMAAAIAPGTQAPTERESRIPRCRAMQSFTMLKRCAPYRARRASSVHRAAGLSGY